MTQSFSTFLTIAVVVGVALAAPRPEKSELSNEISPPVITKNGESVSASWGGFHASASLADDGSGAVASAGGNGLGASSGYGPAGAGAGAGFVGTGDFASTGVHNMKPAAGGYGNGGKPEGPNYHGGVGTGVGGNGGGFFDKIFAIPINVLQSVNTYLNQKQIHQGQPGAVQGQHHNGAASSASASAVYGSDKVPAAAVGADYGHDSAGISANGKTGTPMMVHKNANYDEIFNIPITALRSVQNLLNG